MTPNHELGIVGCKWLALIQNALEHRPDQRPDLTPAILSSLSQGLWMLVAEDRGVGVVVDQDKIATPPDYNWKRGTKTRADGHSQAQGPLLGRSKWRLRPIIGAHKGP